MIHFLYLAAFSILVGGAFGILSNGSDRERIVYGCKACGQFLIISLVLAWVFYFLPW